jgi:hypothetical protein
VSGASCVRCGAPRAAGSECPSCGVIYERAERRAARAMASLERVEHAPFAAAEVLRPPSAAALFARGQQLDDARMELRLAKLAVPVALVAAWLLVHTGVGGFVLRTFGSMWLHELGHAAAAWLCGFPAFPGPWFTPVASERSLVFGLLLTAGAARLLWRAREAENRALAAAAIAFVLAQLFCSLALSHRTAHIFITWAGDAGGMVFGVALMTTFFAPPGHKLHRDWLRWGFLVIGAAGFADVFHVWWAARSDVSKVPLGEYSHGDADPYKLLMSGWPLPVIISRYLAVGFLALFALIVCYVLHLRRTQARIVATEAAEDGSSVDASA